MTRKRVDANQSEIVHDLQRAGATVDDTHTCGKGFPDIVVGFRGATILMEIKIPGEKLNEREQKWHSEWRGGPVVIVHSSDEALLAIGVG